MKIQELVTQAHNQAVTMGWWESKENQIKGNIRDVLYDTLQQCGKELLPEQMGSIAYEIFLRLEDNKQLNMGTRTPLEIHALIVSEIAEAVEEARKGTPPVYFNTPTGMVGINDLGGGMNLKVGDKPQKPEGELIELADAVIRIADYCGKMGWDLEQAIKAKLEYNQSRGHRHGGKLY